MDELKDFSGKTGIERIQMYLELLKGEGSWSEFAAKTGISESYISLIRKGRRSITEDVARKLTEKTDVYTPGMDISAEKLLSEAKISQYMKAISDVKKNNGMKLEHDRGIVPDDGILEKLEETTLRSRVDQIMRGRNPAYRRVQFVPHDVSTVFDKAIEEWAGGSLRKRSRLDVQGVPGIDFDYTAIVESDGGECLFKYIFVDPLADEQNPYGYHVFTRAGSSLGSRSTSEERRAAAEAGENTLTKYIDVFARRVILPAALSEYDEKRRIVVVTNSMNLANLIWNEGKKISYRGNLFIMYVDQETESVGYVKPFPGNLTGMFW